MKSFQSIQRKVKYIFFYLLVVVFISTTVNGQRRSTGANINPATIMKTPKKLPLSFRSFRGMPSSYSLEKYCPTPGDQGNHGTCVAFANAYGVGTILYAKTHDITDKSVIDKYAFSATYLYEQIKNVGDNDCQNGSDPITALRTMNENGDAFQSAVPYSCNYTITDDIKQTAALYKIDDYSILFAQPGMLTTDLFVLSEEEAISSTKKALLEGSPVSCAFFLPETFFRITTEVWTTDPALDTPSDWQHSGHAMTVVGYDDDKFGGAFRVLNSWGTDWADGGFVWMRYKDFTQWCAVALQPFADPFTPVPEEKRNEEPAPDPSPEPAPDPKPIPDPEPKPAPTPEPEQIDEVRFSLSGNVEFTLNTGTAMPVSKISTRNLVVENDNSGEKEDLVAYRMNETYTSGTKFRFYISTDEDCYIYAFATDLTGQVNRILPFDDLMSTHIGSNSVVAFPSDSKVVKMDDQKGTDYLLILYSKEKLNATEIANKMSNMNGGLSKKIMQALGNKLIDKSEINYDTYQVGFSVNKTTTRNLMVADDNGDENNTNSTGTVVPLMIELSHN